jgi:hypothetical protein
MDDAIRELSHKVDKIYTCLIGDDEMGQKGVVEKIEDMEKEIRTLKLLRDRIIIGGGVVATIIIALSWIGERVVDLIKK